MAANNGKSPIIDIAALEELKLLQRPGETDLLGQVQALFESTAPERLVAMRAALGLKDLKSLRKEAHTLKSTSATLGANHMVSLCLRLEHFDESKEPLQAASTLLAELEVEFGVANRLLKNLIR